MDPWSLGLSASSRAPATARRALRRQLTATDMPGDVCEDAELLLSELVSNAVRHGGGSRIVISAALDGSVLRVAVEDESPAHPVPRAAASGDQSGRGLHLLQELAERWGWQRSGVGKQVWFELVVSLVDSRPADDHVVDDRRGADSRRAAVPRQLPEQARP